MKEPICVDLTYTLHKFKKKTISYSRHSSLLNRYHFTKGSSTLRNWKRIKCFRAHYAGEIWTRNYYRSFWVCVWGKLGPAEKSHDYRDVIVFEKLHFLNVFRPNQNAKPAFSNSSGWNSSFEKLCFRDGLVWMVGLTVEIKPTFSNFLHALWTGPWLLSYFLSIIS